MPFVDISIDGNDMSPGMRVGRWRDLIGDHLADVDLSASEDIPSEEAFLGGLRIRSYPSGTLANIASGGQIIVRTAERIRRAHSEVAFFNFVLAGECCLEQDGRKVRPGKGAIFLYDGARPYRIETSPDFQTIAIMVERGRLERALGNLRLCTGRAAGGGDAVADVARRYWSDLFRNLDELSDDAANRLIEAGIDVATPALAAAVGPSDDGTESCKLTVVRATAFMMSAFHRPELSVGEIAAAAGVSTRRLQECFKQTGATPMEHLRKIRLENAHEGLRDPASTHLTISRIMHRAGFCDPAYFSKAFRRAFGVTPSEVRGSILAVATPDRSSGGSGARASIWGGPQALASLCGTAA